MDPDNITVGVSLTSRVRGTDAKRMFLKVGHLKVDVYIKFMTLSCY